MSYSDQEIQNLIRDGKRWQALMSSDRIRIMGGVYETDGTPKKDSGYMHIGVEFWNMHSSKHPDPQFPQDRCRMILTNYADALIKRLD